MARHRVAPGRGRPDEVLAIDDARRHIERASRQAGKDPMEDRAGLSGAQGRVRAGPLRGPRVEGVPSPRDDVHRGLRLPDGGAGPFFPP